MVVPTLTVPSLAQVGEYPKSQANMRHLWLLSHDNPATAPGPPFGGKRQYAISYPAATHEGTSGPGDRDDS